MTAVAENEPLRLAFLPTKAESTLELCAISGLQRAVPNDEVDELTPMSFGRAVVTEKQRLAAEWQRHQLEPPTPSPSMCLHQRFEERRGFGTTLRDAVSGVLRKVVTHMPTFRRVSTPSQGMKKTDSTNSVLSTAPTDKMKKTDSTNTVSTADTDNTDSSPLSIEIGEDFDDLRWWNFLPPDSCNYHFYTSWEVEAR
jgi:hypothetical protein